MTCACQASALQQCRSATQTRASNGAGQRRRQRCILNVPVLRRWLTASDPSRRCRGRQAQQRKQLQGIAAGKHSNATYRVPLAGDAAGIHAFLSSEHHAAGNKEGQQWWVPTVGGACAGAVQACNARPQLFQRSTNIRHMPAAPLPPSLELGLHLFGAAHAQLVERVLWAEEEEPGQNNVTVAGLHSCSCQPARRSW